MPATGNNIPSNSISIRISTGGFSFYCNGQRKRLAFDTEDKEYLRTMAICLCESQLYQPCDSFNIYFDSPYSSLVPQDIFTTDQSAPLLDFSYGKLGSDYVLDSNPITGYDMTNVFAIPAELDSFLKTNFGARKILHIQTPFLVHALNQSKKAGESQMWLNLSTASVFAVLARNGELLFANRFEIKSNYDLVYYTALLFDRFKLSQQDCPVFATGYVEKADGLEKHVKLEKLNIDLCV